jgi:uncharacterized membrane protein
MGLSSMPNQNLSKKMYVSIDPFRGSVDHDVAVFNLVYGRGLYQELICFSAVWFLRLVQRIRRLGFLRKWCLCIEVDVPYATVASERTIVLFNQHSTVVLLSLFIYLVIPSFAL